MDPLRFTTVAHATHRLCNPVDPVLLAGVLDGLGLAAGARALDIGCGKASLLVDLAARHGVRGVGVDLNPAFLDEGRALAAAAGVAGSVALVALPASRFVAPAGSFDLGVCLGSTHALGGYAPTLRALAGWVRAGGRVLVGQGYWKRPPDAAYLARLGAAPEELTDHEGTIAAGAGAGLEPVGAWVSSPADWDRYEDRYAETVERFVAEHPSDPDAPAMRERIGRWRETYLRWGRETLGFGLYLFRRA